MFCSFANWTLGHLLKFFLSLVVRLPKKDRVSHTVIGNNRTRLIRILDFLFPSESLVIPKRSVSLAPYLSSSGIVLGFNHFSLGEIPRLLNLCFKSFPTRDLLFPINNNFYLILCYSEKYLAALGIELCPLLTPRIYDKLIESMKTATGKAEVEQMRAEYDRKYLNRAAEVLNENGVVLVAPSRTRLAVFSSEDEYLKLSPVPPVLRLLALNFSRKFPDCHHLEFIPIPIIPPSNPNRGLNLFRKYYFPASFDTYGLEEAKRKDFDYEFLKTLTSQLPRELAYPSE